MLKKLFSVNPLLRLMAWWNDGFLVEIFDQYGRSVYTYAKQHNFKNVPPFIVARIEWWTDSGKPLIMQECGTIIPQNYTLGSVYSRWLPLDASDRMMMILTHGTPPLTDLEYFVKCLDKCKWMLK
jgi:hypothetical protein